MLITSDQVNWPKRSSNFTHAKQTNKNKHIGVITNQLDIKNVWAQENHSSNLENVSHVCFSILHKLGGKLMVLDGFLE